MSEETIKAAESPTVETAAAPAEAPAAPAAAAPAAAAPAAEAPVAAAPVQSDGAAVTASDDDSAEDEEVVQGVASPVADTAVLAGERARAEAAGDLKVQSRDPANPVNVRELFEAGVHFGHQTRRWNPRMKPYIYGARQGIHIIDLDQTAKLAQVACKFIADTVARGGNVLFVGTKRQAQEIVKSEAERSGMFYVTNRWLGGTLTNFRTMKTGLDRLRNLERMTDDGTYEQLLKKETVQLDKERARLEKHIGGMKGMSGIPQVMFIVDPAQETIAVKEARKLGIKIVAITDTNCDPSLVDFVIPGNDDAIRAIRLITSALSDACLYGVSRRRDNKDGGKSAHAPSGPAAEVIYSGRPKAS